MRLPPCLRNIPRWRNENSRKHCTKITHPWTAIHALDVVLPLSSTQKLVLYNLSERHVNFFFDTVIGESRRSCTKGCQHCGFPRTESNRARIVTHGVFAVSAMKLLHPAKVSTLQLRTQQLLSSAFGVFKSFRQFAREKSSHGCK